MANELIIDYPGYLDPSPACGSVLEIEADEKDDSETVPLEE